MSISHPRHVVVTGAAGGIGAAVVRRLTADGWHVVAADLVPPSASEADPRVRPLHLDVAEPAAVATAAAALRAAGVAVAGLVNAAGVLQDVQPFLTADAVHEQRVWDVNYRGALHCVRAFTPALVAAGGGAIVNVTSVNAHQPLPLHAYAPAKAALHAATALAAGELGRYGIRVNAVAPGFTRTPALRAKLDSGARDASVVTAHSALGRLVEPVEVAAAVAFLLGDDAAAITGVSLPVDAGWLATAHWMDFGNRLDRPEETREPV